MTEEQKRIMGQRIKSMREKYGLSQEDIAEMLAMSGTNISNYESGRTIPPGNVVAKLANIMHTSTDYLLVRTNDPTSKVLDSTLNTPIKVKHDLKKVLESDSKLLFDGNH